MAERRWRRAMIPTLLRRTSSSIGRTVLSAVIPNLSPSSVNCPPAASIRPMSSNAVLIPRPSLRWASLPTQERPSPRPHPNHLQQPPQPFVHAAVWHFPHPQHQREGSEAEIQFQATKTRV